MKFSLITNNKKFSPFFWTQFFGAFNDNFFKNALVVLVAFRGIQLVGMEAKDLVAVAGALFILPFFLFSPLAGQISDKFEKSQVIRATKIAELIIMAIAALGFLTSNYLILLFVLFLMGTQSAFFGPVKYSLIPELVKKDELTEANAFIELGTFIAILLGTLAGGLITSSAKADLYIGLGLIAFALVGLWSSRKIHPAPITASELKLRYNPFPEYKTLIKLTREKLALWNSVLAISWFWFFGAGVLSILPVYVKDYLRADEQVVTIFLAMFTIGVGVGSVLAEKLSFKRVEIGLVPIGSLGMTIFLLDLYLVNPAWTASSIGLSEFMGHFTAWRLLFDFFMMSVFGGIFIVPLYTLLQERSHPESRSRIIAANNIINAIFMVVSSILVIGFYAMELTTAEIFAVFAILNVITAIYIYSVVPEFTLRLISFVLSHIFYRVEVEGRENLPEDGAFILASNHVSFIDWLILFGACDRPARFVMYYKYFNLPLLGLLFRQAKTIPIAGAKEAPEVLSKAFSDISSELQNGEPVIIFPEGRITKDGHLNPFRPGIKKMVDQNPVTVVPVVLRGLWGSRFSRARSKSLPHRRKIKVEILKPIPANEFDVTQLENQFREILGEESRPQLLAEAE